MKKYCHFIADFSFILYRVLCVPAILLALLIVAIFADLPSYIAEKAEHFVQLVFLPKRMKRRSN